MKNIWNWIRNNPNRAMFLLPIFLVAGISISHVVSWYDMANPISWAIYLSIAIEIGAITALVAATNRIKGGIWFMFGLVTFIQLVGNIFYSYKEIDPNGDSFKSWVELTGPIWEMIGTEQTDIVGLKRWLAFLEGGFLPLISLASLHFFVKYEKPEDKEIIDTDVEENDDDFPPPNEALKKAAEKYKDDNEKKDDKDNVDYDEDHAHDQVVNAMLDDELIKDLENNPADVEYDDYEEEEEKKDTTDDENPIEEDTYNIGKNPVNRVPRNKEGGSDPTKLR
jgi:hypothetical protein